MQQGRAEQEGAGARGSRRLRPSCRGLLGRKEHVPVNKVASPDKHQANRTPRFPRKGAPVSGEGYKAFLDRMIAELKAWRSRSALGRTLSKPEKGHPSKRRPSMLAVKRTLAARRRRKAKPV